MSVFFDGDDIDDDNEQITKILTEVQNETIKHNPYVAASQNLNKRNVKSPVSRDYQANGLQYYESRSRIMNSAQQTKPQKLLFLNKQNPTHYNESQTVQANQDLSKIQISQDEYVSYDQISEKTNEMEPGMADTQNLKVSHVEENEYGSEHSDGNAPLSFTKQNYDIGIDLKLGWKPLDDTGPSGAPIPLNYNFDQVEVKEFDQVTGMPIEPLYLGPRFPNSSQMHKQFANKDKVNNYEPISSYTFDFPIQTQAAVTAQKVSQQNITREKPRAFIGMNPNLASEKELRFDSQFESGNLDMVVRTKPWEYDLYMRVDTNTRGHHQWFFFSISYDCEGQFSDQKLKFNVCNFTKQTSLYQYGMRICFARQSQGYIWHKAGENITYGKSKAVRRSNVDPAKTRYYNCMSFTYPLGKGDNDQIYVAYCFPYTFSKLTAFLKQLHIETSERKCLKETVLCKSLSGVTVPLLTVSSRIHTDQQYNLIKLEEFEDINSRVSLPLSKKKKYAVISGRVHPGETPSSWMMQGFLKSITSDSHQAVQLRKRIVFKIVPMLNPDGVIAGNYRTSLAGNDLNRKFDDPDLRLHPTVWNIKRMTEQITYPGGGNELKPENLIFYIDMHGHSRKKNVFMYGPQVPLHSDKYLKMRIIPKLLSDETEMFRYHSCSFQNEKSKETAARITLYREFNIYNCFTLEASFHGYFDKDKVNYEFTEHTYEQMGVNLVNSLYEYVMLIEDDERRRQLAKIERMKQKSKKQVDQPSQAEKVEKSEKKAEQNDATAQKGISTGKKKNQSKTQKAIVKQESKRKTNMITSSKTYQNDNLFSVDTKTNENPDFNDIKKSTNSLFNAGQNPNEPSLYELQDQDGEFAAPNTPEDGVKFKSYKPYLNLDQMFDEVKKLNDDISQDEDEQPAEGEGDQDQGCSGDDLTEEQQLKVGKQILNSIKKFRKVYKLSENQYFGVQSQVIEQPFQTKQRVPPGFKKKQVQQPPAPVTNYQSNTLSIAQKRRSFLESKEAKQKTEEIGSKDLIVKRKMTEYGNRKLQINNLVLMNLLESKRSKFKDQIPNIFNENCNRSYQVAFEFIKKHQSDLQRDQSIIFDATKLNSVMMPQQQQITGVKKMKEKQTQIVNVSGGRQIQTMQQEAHPLMNEFALHGQGFNSSQGMNQFGDSQIKNNKLQTSENKGPFTRIIKHMPKHFEEISESSNLNQLKSQIKPSFTTYLGRDTGQHLFITNSKIPQQQLQREIPFTSQAQRDIVPNTPDRSLKTTPQKHTMFPKFGSDKSPLLLQYPTQMMTHYPARHKVPTDFSESDPEYSRNLAAQKSSRSYEVSCWQLGAQDTKSYKMMAYNFKLGSAQRSMACHPETQNSSAIAYNIMQKQEQQKNEQQSFNVNNKVVFKTFLQAPLHTESAPKNFTGVLNYPSVQSSQQPTNLRSNQSLPISSYVGQMENRHANVIDVIDEQLLQIPRSMLDKGTVAILESSTERSQNNSSKLMRKLPNSDHNVGSQLDHYQSQQPVQQTRVFSSHLQQHQTNPLNVDNYYQQSSNYQGVLQKRRAGYQLKNSRGNEEQ